MAIILSSDRRHWGWKCGGGGGVRERAGECYKQPGLDRGWEGLSTFN